MQAVRERLDAVHLVRDATSGVEAIRARFSAHAYDLHRHDEWLIGVTDRGLQDFFCRGQRQRSTPGRVILIEPGELHDGQAGEPGGFAYQMLYLPTGWLKHQLSDTTGGDPAFRATLGDDERLALAIRQACATMDVTSPSLLRDAALDGAVEALRPHLDRPARQDDPCQDDRVARRARDMLHTCLTRDIGADMLARAAGAADRFHLARSFRAAHATSPHAYLVQLRLTAARRLLRNGEKPAQVAADCGFADQSHLGRWFKRAYGMSPGAYQACCTGVPDTAPA